LAAQRFWCSENGFCLRQRRRIASPTAPELPSKYKLNLIFWRKPANFDCLLKDAGGVCALTHELSIG
jgi:hypothetical protein